MGWKWKTAGRGVTLDEMGGWGVGREDDAEGG